MNNNEQLLLNDLKATATRRRAFAQLVSQYSEKMYWTARHIVGTHQDADDVVQNAFIKVWQKLDEFRGDAKLNTWLHRIVVNEALDHLRRERKHSEETDTTALADSFADTYFDGDEAERLLRTAMEQLPEAQRAVFSLKYFDNLPYKEISQILGTSEGGLKANYHYAVEKIRKYLFPDNC